jgi:ligand-binding SRPBCC domain-containing protein
MNTQYRYHVPVFIEQVAEFHRRSASMNAITPPPIVVRVRASSQPGSTLMMKPGL